MLAARRERIIVSADYIRSMMETTELAFDQLLADVQQLTYVDFPDHANVGDSAIALGAFAYFKNREITVRAAQSLGTHHPERLTLTPTVFAHGGGNLGDLYPPVTEHRLEVLRQTPSDTRLIQGPQSSRFVNPNSRREYIAAAEARCHYTVAARDKKTAADLQRSALEVMMSPDSVHLLGAIKSPPPLRRVVVVGRTDDEAAESRALPSGSVDWIRDSVPTAVATLARTRVRAAPPLAKRLNPRPEAWRRLADARLRRGVALLAQGEVIVTDRLHAVLLGLQMHRRVIAVDNNYGKVHGYIDTWLRDTGADVTVVSNFEDALIAAGDR
jgi:pyruvyl transferase EpsO